jgi:uncharacterized protein (TIGR02145 family)
LLLAAGATAQKLNYSAVVRNGANELVTNANVTIKVTISPNPNGTPVVYSETHAVTTSPNGMVSLIIGDGTPVRGSLSNVSWSTAYVISEFFLPDGSHTSAIMPVSAVPYALFTETISPQGLLDVVQSMTPEQIAALRDSMGIPKPEPISCDTMVDADGNRYASVLIGTQCWTKSNLRVAVGTLGVSSPTSNTFSSTEPYYYVNPDKDMAVYGYLYNWPAAMQACPSGWHLPTNEEWIAMEQTLTTVDVSDTAIGYYGNSAGKLAGGDTTDWNVSNVASAPGNMYYADRNATGFSAVPGGYWWREVKNVGEDAFFWTSSEVETSHAWRRCINFESAKVHRYKPTKPNGMSVRCVKGDLPTPEPEPDSMSCGTMTDADGNTYQTVQIGTQCWTKTNMRTTKKADGTDLPDSIPTGASNGNYDTDPYYSRPTADTWAGGSTFLPFESYSEEVFGLYYNWPAANVICPEGWHLPSDSDWTVLIDYVSNAHVGTDYLYRCDPAQPTWIARALATDAEYWYRGNVSSSYPCEPEYDLSANNATGFSAVPAGFKSSGSGHYLGAGIEALFWSSTPEVPTSSIAHFYALDFQYEDMRTNEAMGVDCYTVRCLRDNAGDTIMHPTVTTDTATGVSSVKATLHGSYTNPQNLPLTSSGFEWKTVDASSYNVANASGDTMSYELTGLLPDTQYTYRAFVATADSTYYGEDVTFMTEPESEPEPEPAFYCGISQMIDADSNHYETVRIGDQCWIKTNLRTTKFRNGNPIPVDIDPDQSSSASFSRISPDYTQTYPDSTFGFYYNWYAAVDTGDSKLCPDGWHVPNDGDWMVLSSYLRGNYACGNNLSYNAKAMADSLLWGDYNDDCSVGKDQENNNASGFSAVPAGYLFYGENSPIMYGSVAYFWTAMPSEGDFAKYYVVSRYLAELKYYTNPKIQLLSVRCIKDDTTTVVKPVVTTDSATAVTTVSAKLHGTLVNPNGIVIVKKGFEWKLSSKDHYNVMDLTGTELITTLENLIPDTQYTFRAFINYDDMTYYGEELTFKTPVEPAVTTENATDIALTSATISGTISNPDQVTLTAKGFVWKKSHGVYEYDTVKFTGGNAMSHTFSDLTPNTKYDYKAFLKYDNKTVYGELRSFTTPNHPEVSCGTMTDADGNLYQTVKIGSQCWAKTNLRTTKYRKGSTISDQIGTTVPAYYRLSNTDKSSDSIVSLATAPDSVFGFYYNGYAAVRDSLCPAGWHVPDTNDWKNLIGYLKARPEYWCDNDNSNLAKAVASRNFWFNVETPPVTYTINQDAVDRPCSPQYQAPDYLNDASYFSAVPAGAWYDNLGGNIDTLTGFGGREFDPGKDAHFWSSSPQPNSDSTGYFFRLGIVTYDVVALAYDALKYGRSVRCLKDAEPEPDPELPFSCGTSRMFDADGHTYETVQIGTQCWTKTNLRSAKDRNGNAFINGNAAFFGGFDATNDSVVYIPTQETWNVNNSLVTYNNSIFGYFYNWKAANLVCPAGWHLPTDAEWTTLTDYVKMESAYACGVDADYIAKALADTTTAWKSFEDDPCAPGYAPSSNNATGFGAVPAGYYYNSSLHDFGDYANFWSSTEYNGPYVYTCSLYYDYAYVDNYSNGKNLGFSVRCLRDE